VSKHFPPWHRVIVEHSITGELLDKPTVTYIKARDFDEWCDEMKEQEYALQDMGVYETLVHAPHSTEVLCYPLWKLIEQDAEYIKQQNIGE